MNRVALALSVLIGAAACRSAQHVEMSIPTEITTDSQAAADGPAGSIASVRVHCTAEDTIFEKDGYELTFRGHRGYSGRLGERHGRLTIGALTFEYDDDGVSWSGPHGGGRYARLPHAWAAVIEQSGASFVH